MAQRKASTAVMTQAGIAIAINRLCCAEIKGSSAGAAVIVIVAEVEVVVDDEQPHFAGQVSATPISPHASMPQKGGSTRSLQRSRVVLVEVVIDDVVRVNVVMGGVVLLVPAVSAAIISIVAVISVHNPHGSQEDICRVSRLSPRPTVLHHIATLPKSRSVCVCLKCTSLTNKIYYYIK